MAADGTIDPERVREWERARARAEFEQADGAFTGRVIAAWTDWGQRRNHYTFAVRQSWKGVEEDTAHVAVPASMGCDPVYVQGRSYLVLAARTPDGFRPPFCSEAIPADSTRGAVYLPVMGTPRRSFPADTVRSIEALVPPSAPHVSGSTRAAVQVIRGDGRGPAAAGVRVSVVGTELGGTTDSTGAVTIPDLDLRWYRFRFEFPDGEVHEEYVFPRCPGGGERCPSTELRFFVGQDSGRR